jgi:hypothetical protein
MLNLGISREKRTENGEMHASDHHPDALPLPDQKGVFSREKTPPIGFIGSTAKGPQGL